MLTIDITYHTATRKMELTSPSQCREVIAGTRGDHNTTQINFTVDGSLNGYNMFCAFGSRDITDAREVRNIEYEVYMTDATHGWVVIPDEIFAGSTRDVVPVQLHMMHSTDDSQYYAFNQIMFRFLPSIPDPTVHVTPISGETQYVSKEAFLIEVSEREAADTALGIRIDAEASTRQSADAALSEAIEAEVSARETAVSGESSARASADTALGGRIDAEIAARQSAVSGEAASRASADTALGGRIDAEQTARAAADTALGNGLTAEQTAREDADTALAGDISSEASSRQLADTALGGRIDAEISARQSADNALSGRIDGKQDILGYTPEDADNKVYAINPESSSSEKYPTDYAVQQFVNSSIPTNVSAFANDAGYLTEHQDISGLATKTELNSGLGTKQNTLIAGVGIEINGSTISADTAFHAQVFDRLPDASAAYKNTIGLILKTGSTTQYLTYMCTTEDGGTTWSWKQIGTTDIDLSDYYTKTQTDSLLDAKQNAITSSNKLSYEFISGLASIASHPTYNNLLYGPVINGHQLEWSYGGIETSLDDIGAQAKLTVGTNIIIENNVISAPTNVSAFTNDAGYLTTTGLTYTEIEIEEED